MEDLNYTKSTCDKYTLRFNENKDWAVFVIDDRGLMQCHSSFGDYSYNWRAFGDNFKGFLCDITSPYLLIKVAEKNCYDPYKHLEVCKKTIIGLRKEGEIDKSDARELWNDCVDVIGRRGSSAEMVASKMFDNEVLGCLYRGDVYLSPFMPETEYSPRAVFFAEKIFPEFVKILKTERGV